MAEIGLARRGGVAASRRAAGVRPLPRELVPHVSVALTSASRVRATIFEQKATHFLDKDLVFVPGFVEQRQWSGESTHINQRNLVVCKGSGQVGVTRATRAGSFILTPKLFVASFLCDKAEKRAPLAR